MKEIFMLLFFSFHVTILINAELNQVDKCLSNMKTILKGRDNVTKTLGGMVGVGWDDLKNEVTLPIFKETYQKCLTDHRNRFLIPDNIILIPVQKTDVDKTSSTFDSYDEYFESNSNKMTITGSVTTKKASASASFSKEHEDTKTEFVKQNCMMFQNKLVYEAYQLIANDNGAYEEAFIRRIKEIADAVEESNDVKIQFLAESLIGDYGTHVVNKATAAAEIQQQYFIEKSEKFKGESHMDKIAVGASAAFEGSSYGGSGSVSVESTSSDSQNETEKTSSMKSILKIKGGPHINRIGSANPEDSMLYVDNLVGTKQSGKFLYDIIPAVPMPKRSEYVRFRVKKAIFDATQSYYKFNYLPGCTDRESENFNFMANDNDGSCQDPKFLFNFGGVFQRCSPFHSYVNNFGDIPFGDQCKQYEQHNIVTGNLSCPRGMDEIVIDSFKHQLNDRSVPLKRKVCYGPRIFRFCQYEIVNETVIDEIYVQAFWCAKSEPVETKPKKPRQRNDLDVIMRNDILTTIDKFPKILELFYNSKYDSRRRMYAEERFCPAKDEKDRKPMKNMDKNENETIDYWSHNSGRYSPYHYSSYSRDYPDILELEADQLDTLFNYPNVIEELLKIIEIRPEIMEPINLLRKSAAKNPIILKQILFNELQSIQHQDLGMKSSFFGGAYQGSNFNPFTGRPACPPNFLKVTILHDFNICISKDPELEWPIRIAGFHHCESLEQDCPRGYSEYLGAIRNGCEYYYCIRFSNRYEFTPPVVNKPPYIKYEKALSETSKTES